MRSGHDRAFPALLKILFVSHVFSPSIGGIEAMSRLLASGFAGAGHDVRVVTQTPGDADGPAGCPVIRRPGMRALWRLFAWCDVVVHSNITLRGLWPLLFFRRPWVVIHHTWIFHPPRETHLAPFVKTALLAAADSICVSQALADSLRTTARVIPNCYDTTAFASANGVARDRDLLFVGRLVPDKGADLLFRAMHGLAQDGLRPKLTVVGGGPEESALHALRAELGLEAQIQFAGVREPEAVATLMRHHRILVVPSRWPEPFGIVALEGIASGCVVVGSHDGGLPDAIGPGGCTFPNGDVPALTKTLAATLRSAPRAPSSSMRIHLARHRPEQIVPRYLAHLTAVADVDARPVI